MTRPGVTRPRSVLHVAAPKVADPQVARAVDELGQGLRDEQQTPKLPRTGVAGDVFYRGADGEIVALPIGTPGQVLTVSADGLPAWEDP